MIRWVVLFAVVLSSAALAGEERYDHHDSIGGVFSLVGARKDSAGTDFDDDGFRAGLEAGGTLNIGGGNNELKLAARVLFGGLFDLGFNGGYRGYFGLDQWKTFADLDLAAQVLPVFTIGPRVGLGVQFDFSNIAGVFGVLSGQIGFGAGIRYGVEVRIGIQLRSFVFEE